MGILWWHRCSVPVVYAEPMHGQERKFRQKALE
jgi:hypothetical protein